VIDRGLVPITRGETVREWFVRFHTFKEGRGLSSVDDMRGRAKNWICPIIGDLAMREVTRKDIESVVRHLDRVVADYEKHGKGRQRLSGSSAANVWGDTTHAFDEAMNSKNEGLRILDANPALGVRGPETSIEREGPILYSDEVRTLLAGKAKLEGHADVPLNRRRVYAVAIYTMARRSEIAALMPGDVDTKHSTIEISKQVDRQSGEKKTTKQTKTKRTRVIDIEPNLWPLIEVLMGEAKDRKRLRLLRVPPSEDCAELLRKDLATVGIERPALFVKGDPSRTPIWFHHLRDTGLTHMALRGDSQTLIQWRAGHTDYKMTSSYVERGRVEARRIGEPLPPLPASLLVVDPEPDLPKTAYRKPPSHKGKIVTPTGIEPVLPT
jgi:integrase